MSSAHTPRFPDFIIAGAMKSGTTSLHAMLAEHPLIFIPSGETGFFDHDDFAEHVDFFVADDGGWREHDFDAHLDEDLDWYRTQFAAARSDQLTGVDSTTYLSSPAAAGRIARHIPEARIIIMLREPAARAYSQYWHMVSAGSVLYSFEDTLRLMPERILTRSRYVDAVRRYLARFPREQLHFVAFEDFTRDPVAATAVVLEFLGLDATNFRPGEAARHANATEPPRWPAWQLLRNRWRWRWRQNLVGQVHYPDALVDSTPADAYRGESRIRRGVHGVFHALNRRLGCKTPPMREDTRRFLSALLRRENRGLSELVGLDLDRLWYQD